MKKQLSDGVYVAINQKLIDVSDYKDLNPDARVAVKFGNYVVIISPCNAPERMNWDDAGKYADSMKMRLGDKLEWMIIDKYIEEIRDALKKLGHDTIPLDWIWTEAEFSGSNAWIYYSYYGLMNYYYKLNTRNVRPVTAFQLR